MNQDYWRQRFAMLEAADHRRSEAYLRELEKLYLNTQLWVQKEIEAWYGRFAKNNCITLTEAKKLLTSRQLEEFKWTVEQYVRAGEQAGLSQQWMKQLENASARFHISRLEAIQMQISQQIELLYGNQVDGIDALLRELIQNGYTRGAYEVQKGIGLGWDLVALDQGKLDALLSKPWTTDGRTFRDRCWGNKAALVGSLHKGLIQSTLRGDAPQKTIAAIQKQFGTARYQAARLVHTETSYFGAVSKRQMYGQLGVEQLEIVETLDSHTCALCQPMDGKVIPLSQYQPGVTVPPFHPNCRGTTCPHYDDMEGERAARDAEGKVYYVPADMTYAEWEKAFVEGGSKEGLTAIEHAKQTPLSTKTTVHDVGKIDIEKYRCVTPDIATDQVIITDERIQHIKERHPGDYERYMQYLGDIVAEPDYILEANKPNTAFVLKGFDDEHFELILKLKIYSDPENYKNSIITFLRVKEKKWNKYLRNKKILYKRE